MTNIQYKIISAPLFLNTGINSVVQASNLSCGTTKTTHKSVDKSVFKNISFNTESIINKMIDKLSLSDKINKNVKEFIITHDSKMASQCNRIIKIEDGVYPRLS
ncbi:hypothetical protein KM800_07985 [Clostridium tyrobutyricum]|nr:hypothetical protein [Clostridium tyrobutyricum]